MANARDFGPGKTDIFALTLVWRRELNRLGRLYGELATTDRGDPRWHKLQQDTAMLAHELAERGARAEFDARRYREMVTEEEHDVQETG